MNLAEIECNCSALPLPSYKDFRLEKHDNNRCTTSSQLRCAKRIYTKVFQNKDKHCPRSMCPLGCNKMTYSFAASTTNFPTAAYGNKLLKNSFVSKKYPNISLAELEKRLVALNIYYPKLSYSFVSEQQQYTITDLISSIGGSLGLLLGASLLSLMEVVDLFLRIFMIFLD